MQTLRIYDRDDKAGIGDYMYDPINGGIYVQGSKGLDKARFDSKLIHDTLNDRIFYADKDQWQFEHLCGCCIKEIQVIIIGLDQDKYILPCVYHNDCTIKYSQLSYNCGVVSLQLITPGQSGTVILQCDCGLYIYVFVKPSVPCSQYQYISVGSNQTTVTIPAGLSVCSSMPAPAPYDPITGIVDVTTLRPGQSFILSTISSTGAVVYVLTREQYNFCQTTLCPTVIPMCPSTTPSVVLDVPTNDYPTINDAISAVTMPNTLIRVAGTFTYNENVIILGPNTNLNGLMLIGVTPTGGTAPVIQGLGTEPTVSIVAVTCVLIQGFSIMNTTGDNYGISVSGDAFEPASATIQNNTILDTTIGIYFQQATVNITDNVISTYSAAGIAINDSSSSNIYNNTITSPETGVLTNGIFVDGSSTAVISENKISGNTDGGFGIWILTQANDNIVLSTCINGNTIFDNDYGITVDQAYSNLIQSNTIEHNTVYGLYTMNGSSANVFINNIVQNNGTNDIFDDTIGFLSASTANAYYCNQCTEGCATTCDNRGGALCASIGPYMS